MAAIMHPLLALLGPNTASPVTYAAMRRPCSSNPRQAFFVSVIPTNVEELVSGCPTYTRLVNIGSQLSLNLSSLLRSEHKRKSTQSYSKQRREHAET
jgi:hypothetical protein